MCKLKSGIVLKDRIYIGDTDSHTDMLEKLGIEDNSFNPNFVRFELTPPCDDIFTDINTWVLRVDQDFRPDWFFEEVEKPKIVTAVKAWAKDHVYIGVDNLDITLKSNETRTLYLKDCKDANVRTYDTSTANVETWGTSTANVETYDTSTATVRTRNTSTATVRTYFTSTANVWTYDTSIANAGYSETGSKINSVVLGNSTFKNHTTRTIYQSGNWQFVEVRNTEDK